MSETPERKVLKEMIQKLKAKLIQSVNTYSTHLSIVSTSAKDLKMTDTNSIVTRNMAQQI